jgi:hypothetical protein
MEKQIIVVVLFAIFLLAAIIPRIIQKRKRIETVQACRTSLLFSICPDCCPKVGAVTVLPDQLSYTFQCIYSFLPA